ncbi:hypothetical protein [Halobaculum sp. D14]|uniref:hypothetical protein n=1 Tax=Halobaculum sp. D14 TaxID=3421642 RepID=UPI003EB89800
MSDIDLDSVRAHYEEITPVVEELAELDGHLTIGLNDYSGWYVRRDHDDFDVLEEGYEQEGRCATLAQDYGTVRSRIERALYALTTYKARDAFVDWEPCTVEDGQIEWMNGSPTPGYGDLRGVMAWGDIDLADELKPQRGDLDEDTQQVIEETLAAYVEEYARLYGDRDAIFALDSVGGSYVMGAPAATLPIAEVFEDDPDARERVMEAFVDRSNDWLKEAQKRVEERVDGAAEVIDPDWVNNCNRQYKAPLSLHADHDAVVVPLDTEDPTYELVPFDDVDEDLVEETTSWAADFTSTEHRGHAETLVKRLWPDEYEAYDSWGDALKAWVEEEREREERQEEARQRARERRRERKEQMGGGVEGAPVTPFITDVYDALDALDIEDVADRTIVHQWTDRASGMRDNSGDGKRAFVPIWGTNAESGNANFVDTDTGFWVDTGDDYSGGPVKMALIAEENWDRDATPSGDDWRRGLQYLRGMGFEIPVWTPDARSQNADGEEYEQMPYWAVREAAVALGVLPEDAFIHAQSERGGYLRFPGKETYNHALAAIEDAGLDHGREYMSDDGGRPDDLEDVGGDDTPPAPTSPPQEDPDAPTPDAVKDGQESDDGRNANVRAHIELDVENGGYGYWNTNHETGDTWFERVTNFTIEVESFFFNDGERLIEMTVVPGTGEEPYELTVPTKVFNDVRRFRDNVVTGLTTTFDGTASDLNELRKLVGVQDAPVRTGTHHMGLHPDTDEFVTPNGVLTADGWVEDPDTAYIEREISAERAWSLTPDDNTEYDPQEVSEILELVPKSRISERFLPAIGWLYTAPLRPYVQDWEGQFNTLHVTGETGAGKSSSLSILWQLLGMNGEPMACDDTKFALITSMASTNSIPMWYDEYKPGDMKDWEVDRFQNLMRSTTRGGVATRGNADKSTEEYELKAPVMISGEQSMQGAAEERRSIQTRFRDTVKDPGSPTKEAFAHLTGMAYDADGETREPEGYNLEQHALAYYQFVLRQDEDTLKRLWIESRESVRELLTTNDVTGVDDLPRQGVQTIHFGMTLYRRFAEQMAAEADLAVDDLDLPTDEEIGEAMLYIAEQFGDGGSRKSHQDRFIELAARAATEEYLEEGKHFTFVNAGDPDEQLALKLSSVHDRVSKYVRDHGLDGEDLLNTAKDYRDRMNEEADNTDSYVITHSQYTPPLARCARIDTSMAEEQLEFNRFAFGAEPRGEEEEVEGDSDGGDGDGGEQPAHPDPVSIGEIDPGKQDVASVIAAVEFGKFDGRSTQEGTPAWTATLSDETGEAELVVWDEDAIPQMYDQTGRFEADALHVKGAEIGEYDGKLQLVVGTDTIIDRAQLGAGEIADAERPDGQSSIDAAEDAEPAVDGGEEMNEAEVTDQTEAAVAEHVRTEVDSGDEVSVANVAGTVDVSPDAVRDALEALAEKGRQVTRAGSGGGEFEAL